MKTLQEEKDEWYRINAPLGKQLGYPDCCINEFCAQPPEILRRSKGPTKDDIMRYNAGCIYGQFTGFIPCATHAKQIMSGQITLHSLIKDRDIDFPLFPNLV